MKRFPAQSFVPRLTVLSEEQKETLHLATLEILRRTGVRVYSEEAVSLLRKAGCVVTDGSLVKIPSHLIEEAIRTAPPSIILYDRNGEPAMRLEGSNAYHGTGSDLPNVIDPFTGERRKSTKADLGNAARLCDALPNVDFVMSMALPQDVPVGTSDLHSFDAMVRNTTKPIVYTAHDREGLAGVIEMAALVSGGIERLQERPFLLLYAEPSSPLRHSGEAVDKLLLVAEKNLPVAYVPGIVTGSATPVTMPGTMIIANAELLSGLLIAQLKRPGVGCAVGTGAGPLDMRTSCCTYAAPEFMLTTTALVEMGRYYRLPTWGFSGCSDSKVFDEQASLEGALWVLVASLSGTNLAHDLGYIESGMTCSFEQMVVMDDVVGMVKRIMGGIEFSEETMALDLIHEAGPGGQFLTSEHTLKHFKENWYPSLIDRGSYSDWELGGKKRLGDRAREKVQEILASHKAQPLPEGVSEALQGIIDRAEAAS